MTVSVPRSLLVHDAVYRFLSYFGDDGLMGLGFGLKGDGADGFIAGQLHWSAVWCLRGSATFDDGTTRCVITPGTLFQRFPGHPHRLDIASDGNWAETWIALSPPLCRALECYRILDRRRPISALPIDVPLLRELKRTLDVLRAADEVDLPTLLVRLQGLAIGMLGHGRVAERRRDTPIDEACRRLAADPRLDLRRLARELGLGYEHFRKAFREQIGMSPGHYRIQSRIARARDLLLTTDRPVQDIAAELGYANPYVFSLQFRRQVGCAPSGYRRRR